MIDDKERLHDKTKKTFIITHNLKGRTISEWVNQFKSNEEYRLRNRKDSVRLTHEIISWHHGDSKHITLEKMERITREYIRQRNPKGLYVAVPHFDKDHFHVHICVSGIEYKIGKSLRLSKVELQNFKNVIQQYQTQHFPELSHSIVKHSKKGTKVSDREYQFKLREGRKSDKEVIQDTLQKCIRSASSKVHFLELLEKNNLKVYERSGRLTGVILNGNKFRFSRLGIPTKFLERVEKADTRRGDLSEIRKENKRSLDHDRFR